MAREQPNVGELLPLLESSDLRQLDEIKALINEQLSTERGSVLLNSLVDYYLETNSTEAMQILTSVREPHDKHLLDKLNECMVRQASRLPTLTLLGHVVRKQPSWIHKIARFPLLLSLLKCLKTDTDVVVLITGVLVLIILLPMIPQAGKQHLYEFFDIFGRLAAWNLKHPGQVSEVYLIHLHASVYSLFHRLYGMYPCNFVSYLRSHYSMKENMSTFEEVVKPMLEHVRIHPELVTGTKDHELDPTRWKKFEIHDIVIECAKVSLDPKEASCEEGYSSMPEHYSAHLQLRPLECAASPYTDFHSSYGSSSSTPFYTPRQPLPLPPPPLSGTQPPHRSPQTSQRQALTFDLSSSGGGKDPVWSPSFVCGMNTPPSSRGISPTNAPELSQSASHFPGRVHSTPAGGKGTPSSSTPAASSPHPTLSEEFVHISLPSNTASPPRKDGRPAESSKPCLVRQEPIRELEKGSSVEANNRGIICENVTMTLTELSVYIKEQELELQQRTETEREDALAEELRKITEDKLEPSVQRGFDSPFYRTTETLTGNQEKPSPARDPHNAASTPDKAEGLPGGVFTPIDYPATERYPRSPTAAEEEGGAVLGKFGLFSPSPCKAPALPYDCLFDLALPKAATLFVGRRTAEAVRKVREELRLVEDREAELDAEREGAASMSPLEVLDRLIQQGSDLHHKVLKRLPLPSKSADWTHFGAGSAPLDELDILRSQLLLLHNQLLYERYKREQHAVRNRRLLRRIINATALEEQNSAMKDQLNLQNVEILSLRESLQVEQQRYRQLWEDREAVVNRLHNQNRQLHQGRDEYYTKTQELESKLQECQKRIGELEAELQKANNKVCHMGHQLNQLSVKLTSSETAQQQMAFLSKQLLLLGEVNTLCVEELQHSGADSNKKVQMLHMSAGKDLERMRQSLVQQGQRLEAAQQRVAELETQLTKKEHLIVEQKLFLEDVKGQARAELQASEGRYQAQRQVTQALQTELLQLYSRLETKCPAAGVSVPPGGATEPCGPPDTRPEGGSSSALDGQVTAGVQDGVVDGGLSDSQTSNSSTLSPGKPQAPPMSNSINGSRELPPPLLEPPVPRHASSPAGAPGPADVPLTVGSYPSAKSFLGMQARELFRNKSESQCEEDAPRLAGLSQGLKTELCVEPAANAGPAPARGPARATPAKEAQPDAQQRANNRHAAGGAGGAGTGGSGGVGHVQQRQQQLRIMDYNETHQEHS
ncbi:TSC complex subunit 1b isoform X1 [Megalops cyprinoides]|uniref:TSC complex subunit 1b isoform X1 n=1 Tax=Megalops cyprinoides TaxID=118141 RepID=UPI001864D123|nr:TSC complex subunit 1b isoform X1 [Megalops cyprinoides]XP_036384673.1 TSC complex subunit 1b isoform X1 [Megalops cyprinoides]